MHRVLAAIHSSVILTWWRFDLSPVSIQLLALRALRKRKPQETQALALASVYATDASASQ